MAQFFFGPFKTEGQWRCNIDLLIWLSKLFTRNLSVSRLFESVNEVSDKVVVVQTYALRQWRLSSTLQHLHRMDDTLTLYLVAVILAVRSLPQLSALYSDWIRHRRVRSCWWIEVKCFDPFCSFFQDSRLHDLLRKGRDVFMGPLHLLLLFFNVFVIKLLNVECIVFWVSVLVAWKMHFSWLSTHHLNSWTTLSRWIVKAVERFGSLVSVPGLAYFTYLSILHFRLLDVKDKVRIDIGISPPWWGIIEYNRSFLAVRIW